MPNGVLTRWELTPNDKFNEFYTEFIDYLQQSLIRVPRFPDAPESELIWVCPENFMKIIKGCGDPDFGWAMYSRHFCESKNLYWPEVRDMIQEYSDCIITCDCHILEEEEYRVRERNNCAG